MPMPGRCWRGYAVVEFGDSVHAQAVTAGGESGDDQAERYARGDLREVCFYPGQLRGHTKRETSRGAGAPVVWPMIAAGRNFGQSTPFPLTRDTSDGRR
jgi:hypothetical protein